MLACPCLAISLLTSVITRNQVVRFILAVVICLFLILCGWPPVTNSVINWGPAWVVDSLASLGVMTHFESLQRGVVDSRDLLFFVSIISSFLFAITVVPALHCPS